MPEPSTLTRIQDVFRKQQQHRWVMARTTAAERCDRLRRLNSALANDLKKNLRLRHIPRLRWVIDPVERRAAEYENAVKDLDLR